MKLQIIPCRLELKEQREVFLKAEAVAATKAVKQSSVFAMAGLPGDDVELGGSDQVHRMADGRNLTLANALAYLKWLPLLSEGQLRKLPGRDALDGPVTYFLRKCEAHRVVSLTLILKFTGISSST